MPFCTSCGTEVHFDARSCMYCGAEIDPALLMGHSYVVVDVETTGLYNSDRVVEVAAVTVSPEGHIVDEWDTLVDPQRDVGPSDLHGITASMVSLAPRFQEIAPALAARIHDAILVAHNLPFDSRMLANEFARVDGTLDAGKGICTLSRTGQRLPDACYCYGITLTAHHRALADARATAQLLAKLPKEATGLRPASVTGLSEEVPSRTLRRDAVLGAEAEMPHLARVATRAHHRGESGPILEYLDMLDWALADLRISSSEEAKLRSIASSLGLSDQDVARAHERYLRELTAAAARDCTVTVEERGVLEAVARALGIDPQLVEEAVRPWQQDNGLLRLEAGMAVCFTGSVVSADGMELPRAAMIAVAENLGLEVVDTVTKKHCNFLVAADPSSQSGKAKKARLYGLPVVDARDFLCADPGTQIPAR